MLVWVLRQMLVSFTFMKKSFSMAAVMMAAAVLSISSFVSCDEEEESKNVFESKTFSVELPVRAGTGYSWQWTNATTAAADSVSTKIVQEDVDIVGGKEKVIWTFKTKENGEEVLKFRYLQSWDESTIVKDTVITFKK